MSEPLIRVAVRVRPDDAERALAELLELAPAGVDERDLGDAVEYGVYATADAVPDPAQLRERLGSALLDIATEPVPGDWRERWREFHVAAQIGERLLVRAPWHAPHAGLTEIVIDPGQAFGTGAHPTTRLCLALLLEIDPQGAVVDVGCGSGVLAIAAAKLGFGPVLGVDHEDESVRATQENAGANGVVVETLHHDIADAPPPGARTVLANLLGPLLLALARGGFAGEQPAAMIASGLLEDEADAIAAAFAQHQGLVESARMADAGWCALLLLRAPALSST